jgi:outer membrane protein
MQRSISFLSGTLLLALMWIAAPSVSAQRIAYIDMDKILNSMPEYQQAQQELDRVAQDWRQDIAQKYDVIKGMYNKYQADQVLLSEDMRKQREEEIMAREQEVRELQKQRFGPEGDLFKRRKQLVEPIQDKVYSAIESYANEKGYDFIFDRASPASGIIFSTSRYDKTEDILEALGVK